MKLTKKKKIAVSASAAVLALVIAAVSVISAKSSAPSAGVGYLTGEAVYSPIEKTVSATGNVEFAEAGEVKVLYGILVDEVLVESGDSVKAGDVLAKLNKTSVINKLVDAIAYKEYINEQLEDSEITSLEKEAFTAALEEMDNIIAELEAFYTSPVLCADATGIAGEIEIAAGETTGTAVSSAASAAASSSSGSDVSSILSAYLGAVSPVMLAVGGSNAVYASDESEESTTEETTTEATTETTTQTTTTTTTETTAQTTTKKQVTTKKITTTEKTTASGTTTTKRASVSGSGTDYASALAEAAQNSVSTTQGTAAGESSADYAAAIAAAASGAAAGGTGTTQGASDIDYSAIIASALESSDDSGSTDYASAITAALASSGDASSIISSSQSFNTEKVTAVSFYSGSEVKIAVSIDELDILDIEKGQAAAVTLDAVSGEAFAGEITAVSQSASAGSGNTKYTVDVTLDKSTDMRIGMSATVVITTHEKDSALVIPVAALQEKESKVFVYTSTDEDGALTGEREVETGISDGTNAEILTGLSAGDTVYYEQTDSEQQLTGTFVQRMTGSGSTSEEDE